MGNLSNHNSDILEYISILFMIKFACQTYLESGFGNKQILHWEKKLLKKRCGSCFLNKNRMQLFHVVVFEISLSRNLMHEQFSYTAFRFVCSMKFSLPLSFRFSQTP